MSPNESFLSRFIKGIIPIGLGNTTRQALGLISTMIIVRYMPMESYGIFVLLEVYASLVTQFSSFGLDLTMTQNISSNPDIQYRTQLVNTIFSFRFLVLLFVSVLTYLLAAPILQQISTPTLENYIIFLPIIFIIESFIALLENTLGGFELFSKSAVGATFSSILKFILTLLFIAVWDFGILGLIYARIISQGLACIYLYLMIPVKKQFKIDFETLGNSLKFGFPLLINNILDFVYRRFDSIFIGALLGPAEIALYEIARKIPDAFTRLYNSFITVYFPLFTNQFAEGDQEKSNQTLATSIRWLSFIGILGTLIAALFGEQILGLVFVADYQAASFVFTLLMIVFSLTLIEHTLGYSLVSIGEADKPAIVMFVLASVSLVSNILLIPQLGIQGAAWATILGFISAIPLNIFFLSRKGVTIRTENLLKPILSFLLFWTLISLIVPTSLISKFAILALFILVSIWLSVIRKDDLKMIIHTAKSFRNPN